jgi:hypothetical protein
MTGGAVPRQFLLTALLTIALALAVVAGLGVAVDPYELFGTPRIAGWTAQKPYAATYDHISKPYAVSRSRAGTIVTGSSIATYGIEPADPAWGDAPRPIYNLGLKGSKLADQRTLLLHALVTTQPTLVIIVLSFEDALDLLVDNDSPQREFYRRLRVRPDGTPNPAFQRQWALDLASSTLTLGGLRDDLVSILAQGSPVPDQGKDGFERHGPEEAFLLEHGARASLEVRNSETARRIARWLLKPEWPLAPLTDMITASRHAGADVVVLVAPVYAAEWELRRQTGVLDRADDWLHRVVETTEAVGDPAHVRLWDFSALSAATMEAFPEQSPLAAFIDTVHFRPAIGARIIARIMGRGQAGFGAPLERASIDTLLATSNAQGSAWANANPDGVASIAASIAQANEAECKAGKPSCVKPR